MRKSWAFPSCHPSLVEAFLASFHPSLVAAFPFMASFVAVTASLAIAS